MNNDLLSGESVEERLIQIERRIAELEALIKGLTEEMLDMKAVVMKLKMDQRPAPIIKAVASSVAPSIARESLNSNDAIKPEDKTEPVHEVKERITLKMQPDGTLKPERESGEAIIVASGLDARAKARNSRRQNDVIVAEEEK